MSSHQGLQLGPKCRNVKWWIKEGERESKRVREYIHCSNKVQQLYYVVKQEITQHKQLPCNLAFRLYRNKGGDGGEGKLFTFVSQKRVWVCNGHRNTCPHLISPLNNIFEGVYATHSSSSLPFALVRLLAVIWPLLHVRTAEHKVALLAPRLCPLRLESPLTQPSLQRRDEGVQGWEGWAKWRSS